MAIRRKARPVTDRENDAAALAEFMKTKKITKLPPSAAMVIGEATPGWRHEQDRRNEHRYRATADRGPGIDGQIRIADRIGVPTLSAANRVRRKNPGQHVTMCQFFDKRCIIHGFEFRGAAERSVQFLADKYGVIGARFFVVFGYPPTQISWKVTVKPLLERQLARHRLKIKQIKQTEPEQTLQA